MRPRPLALALALFAASLPLIAHADTTGPANLAATTPAGATQPAADPASDPTVARLLGAKSTLKWNYSTREGRYGHAEALVDAPAEKVVKTALEFQRYRDLHRKFATARVIAKEGSNTDVYMRYPVQIGPLTIEFYEVMRFSALRTVGNAFVIEGHGIKGDMKQGHTVITVKPAGPKHAVLQVDVLLELKVPAPQSLVDEELRDGANDFVDGLRHRAQGWVGPVTSL
jgi:carbon monoxide dehydrogenase subunit G